MNTNTDPRIEKFKLMAEHYQAEKLAGVPSHLISPTWQVLGMGETHVGEAVTDPLTSSMLNGCWEAPCGPGEALNPLPAPCNGRI